MISKIKYKSYQI